MTAPSFRQLFGHRLWLLAQAVEKRTEAAVHAVCGLSMREARILATVSSAGEARLGYIREAAVLERAYASRLIAGLVARGLLEKHADPDDQRTAKWVLTDRGRQIHAAIHEESVKRNRAWLDMLSPDQQAVFNDCIEILTTQLNAPDGGVVAAGSPPVGGNLQDDERTDDIGLGSVDDPGGGGRARARARARPGR